MKGLTKRQNEVLGFLEFYIDQNKFPPTIREISQNFQISVKGAYDHVKALEKKGFIRTQDGRSRAIEISNRKTETIAKPYENIPILGRVAAGAPLLAEENLEGQIPVPKSFLDNGSHFALHVKGDSMSGAGILDGDTAILRKQQTANNGEIVVALVDEAVTLKRFYKEASRVRLQPENPEYYPLYTQDVKVLGKLVTIIRQY
jgi:repressor LexA